MCMEQRLCVYVEWNGIFVISENLLVQNSSPPPPLLPTISMQRRRAHSALGSTCAILTCPEHPISLANESNGTIARVVGAAHNQGGAKWLARCHVTCGARNPFVAVTHSRSFLLQDRAVASDRCGSVCLITVVQRLKYTGSVAHEHNRAFLVPGAAREDQFGILRLMGRKERC